MDKKFNPPCPPQNVTAGVCGATRKRHSTATTPDLRKGDKMGITLERKYKSVTHAGDTLAQKAIDFAKSKGIEATDGRHIWTPASMKESFFNNLPQDFEPMYFAIKKAGRLQDLYDAGEQAIHTVNAMAKGKQIIKCRIFNLTLLEDLAQGMTVPDPAPRLHLWSKAYRDEKFNDEWMQSISLLAPVVFPLYKSYTPLPPLTINMDAQERYDYEQRIKELESKLQIESWRRSRNEGYEILERGRETTRRFDENMYKLTGHKSTRMMVDEWIKG